MANGGYTILDLTKIKNWNDNNNVETATQEGIFEKLSKNDKPIIVHGLNTLPSSKYAEYSNDFFISTVTKSSIEIAISFDFDITISNQNEITIS